MHLMIMLSTATIRVVVSDDDDKKIAVIDINCAKFATDIDEPIESALVRLLTDIESASVTAYKNHDPFADEYSLHEGAVRQIKLFYPGIQSTIRQVKRGSATHRDCNLRQLKKELNLK